jgi:hypothetical protein
MQKPVVDNFENAFREAFDKASLAPPDIIWTNIENTLPEPTTFGTNSAISNISRTAKVLVATGVILFTALTYFYFNDNSTTIQTKISKPSTNETITKEPIERAKLDTKFINKNLAEDLAPITKSKIINQSKTETALTETENTIEIDEIEPNKILTEVNEMAPKGLHLPKIVMDTPDLVPNTDSQQVVPYFDPNAILIPTKNKDKFWQNFKIRGGIRISN